MTDTDSQRLSRASRYEAALADADRAMARAVDSAPAEAHKALLAAWRLIRTHHAYARRDLRVQANAAGAA